MTSVTAQLNDYRQSPRKVRLVATAIKGKSVAEAKNRLEFITKRAVTPLHKLLNSAIANAKNIGLDTENLLVKSLTVDTGKILYRRMPVAHGAAHPIRKRTSHVKITLAESQKDKSKTKNSKLKAKS